MDRIDFLAAVEPEETALPRAGLGRRVPLREEGIATFLGRTLLGPGRFFAIFLGNPGHLARRHLAMNKTAHPEMIKGSGAGKSQEPGGAAQ